MKLKMWIEDTRTGGFLEDLGVVEADSPADAYTTHSKSLAYWEERGYYSADICWREVQE